MSSSPRLSVLKDIGFTLLNEGKVIKLRAEGMSMYPSIKPGSVIYIEPVLHTDLLERGDIIVWKRDSGFVAHRLVRKFEKDNLDYFVTRGDCKMHEDSPVTGEIIAGKVIDVEYPEGKKVKLKSFRKRRPDYLFNRISVTLMRIFRSL
jgi:signal peptidase I